MASYSKQMIIAAQAWLAANPDPQSQELRIPRDRTRTVTSSMIDDKIVAGEAALRRYVDNPATFAEISMLLGELRATEARRDAAFRELREVEDELERAVNQEPNPRQTKYGASRSDPSRLVELGRWFLAWARHGYNVMELSASFVAAMLLTDARAIDVAEVRMPFGGILMLIPDGFARGAEGASYTKIHMTELTGGHLSLCASDGARMIDTLIRRDGLTWDSFDDLPGDLADEDQRAAHTVRQIVFCALAYVGAVQSSMERRDAAPRKRSAHVAERAPCLWSVGRTIQIHPDLVRAARGGAREISFRIKHRHIVRGHYREQPHGPRRSERKRIWIAPFWKGPTDGAALVHTYQIDEARREDP
jgi:hypothetical protein